MRDATAGAGDARCWVLCYHSTNIAGNAYDQNDHVALAADLENLDAAGVELVDLDTVVAVAQGSRCLARPAVALTFDDGCALDAEPFEHPQWGLQRGFLAILRDFAARHPAQRVSAASFVIASPEAREQLDQRAYLGLDIWHQRWWREASDGGLLRIENHSWDHNHPLLDSTLLDAPGRFDIPMREDQVRAEVGLAAEYIARSCGRAPTCFAYPWGQSSAALRADLARLAGELGLLAAFGTRPEPIRPGADLWDLPRFVCGEHWRDPQSLPPLRALAA
jgi:peptidoglycan/xylan/chitin deacetylase (PgdA/CDA1 family)